MMLIITLMILLLLLVASYLLLPLSVLLGLFQFCAAFAAPNDYHRLVNGRFRQRPQICGYARFDTVGGFDPNHTSRMIGRVFECAEPSVWLGYNKLLFKRILKNRENPDSFFLLAKSDWMGQVAVGKDGWRSTDSWLLAFSECAELQEALLLMPVGGWIQTTIGKFVVERLKPDPSHAGLALKCEP